MPLKGIMSASQDSINMQGFIQDFFPLGWKDDIRGATHPLGVGA